MNTSEYFHRPHLLIAIILGIIAFLILTYAAAKTFMKDEPVEDLYQPVIATEGEAEVQPSKDAE